MPSDLITLTTKPASKQSRLQIPSKTQMLAAIDTLEQALSPNSSGMSPEKLDAAQEVIIRGASKYFGEPNFKAKYPYGLPLLALGQFRTRIELFNDGESVKPIARSQTNLTPDLTNDTGLTDEGINQIFGSDKPVELEDFVSNKPTDSLIGTILEVKKTPLSENAAIIDKNANNSGGLKPVTTAEPQLPVEDSVKPVDIQTVEEKVSLPPEYKEPVDEKAVDKQTEQALLNLDDLAKTQNSSGVPYQPVNFGDFPPISLPSLPNPPYYAPSPLNSVFDSANNISTILRFAGTAAVMSPGMYGVVIGIVLVIAFIMSFVILLSPTGHMVRESFLPAGNSTPRRITSTTFIPCWPVGDGSISQTPDNHGNPAFAKHPDPNAVDIAVEVGTPVYSASNGVVRFAGTNNDGYGELINISDGTTIFRYAHLSEILVDVGESVVRGQLLGKTGNTGDSSGPHLHFETDGIAHGVGPALRITDVIPMPVEENDPIDASKICQ